MITIITTANWRALGETVKTEPLPKLFLKVSINHFGSFSLFPLVMAPRPPALSRALAREEQYSWAYIIPSNGIRKS
jgi:hypothetical protein